jgi:hypothetical protein
MTENEKRGFREQAKIDLERYQKERIELEGKGVQLVPGKRKMQLCLPKRKIGEKGSPYNMYWNSVKVELRDKHPNTNTAGLIKVILSLLILDC